MNLRKLFLSVMAAGLLALLVCQLLVSHAPALAAAGTDIVGPLGSVTFGQAVYALPTGNIVIVDAGFNGSAGAVYLYNSATRALISRLTGGNPNDQVGSDGVTVLPNGNYVVVSNHWNGDMGAATWGSGASGVTGTVSASNSLVGSSANDQIGNYTITTLSNGNYVVRSAQWNGNLGAATWGSGTSGVTGVVSSANSLVGSNANDQVGFYVKALSNGNYVVQSTSWNGNRGAATWGSGASGITGVVSASNSLVGSTANDQVGSSVNELSNGYFIAKSVNWAHGVLANAGAMTLGLDDGSTTGPVTTTNSVLGGVAGGGPSMRWAFDSVHITLVVGRPNENIVTLFINRRKLYLPLIRR